MNNINPWIGLNSYQEGQILYGRSREIQDLSMSVFYNRQTVVYGKSGIGKSSLLHAGIFPMARLRGSLPISVRFDHASELSYRQQLIQRITEAVLAVGGTMGDSAQDADEPKSLWEFFHRMQPQKDGQIITPLIVIDQFEEIFTLSKNTQAVRAFFDELADLFNNVMPDYLNADNALQKTKETGSIFDGLSVLSANRFEQEMSYHMVFVLREDYLSYLERYAAHIPALKQNRYGLLPITYQQAMEIITKPCEGLVSTEVADTIIRHITPDQDVNNETPIDSAILSLYLSRLFEKKKDAPTISMQLVKEQGEALIEDFYAEVVATIDRETMEYLEDVLINTDGHRENVTIESLYKKAGIDSSAIRILENAHLLRIFSYGNVQRVEFAHDVLCPIIVRRRSQRQNIARMRKVQRTGILAMLALVIVLFGSLYIILEREESKASIAKQQARLSEMEVSLIEKGAQKMLDNHDIYGAIQLLINSLDDNEQYPSEKTARLEKILRESVDSLLFSKNKKVASVHRKMHLEGNCIISKSKRICGVSDLRNNAVYILDSETGAIVQSFIMNDMNSNFTLYFMYVEPDEYFTRPCVLPVYVSLRECFEIRITDIHPNDTRCLLVVNDTTLLDCFIYTGEDKYLVSSGEFGTTRLCIHDIHSNISEAAYTSSGDSIAILLSDSTILLYDALTGKRIHDDTASAQTLTEACARRQKAYEFYEEKDEEGANGRPKVIELTDYTRLSYDVAGAYIVTLSTDNEIIKQRLLTDSSWTIHVVDSTVEKNMSRLLDSIPLSKELLIIKRTYYWNAKFNPADTILNTPPRYRYVYPLAVNKWQNRVAVALLAESDNEPQMIYCLYPHNGAACYKHPYYHEVHTLHFTEDDQYLVVNYGEETQEVIYLPPLEQLVDSCKNMFFDWQMTEEERYQTYIHMND